MWYIFPDRKEDKLMVLIVISTALLIKTAVYPHLQNPYWIMFMDYGEPILIVYLWIFSIMFLRDYYRNKYKKLEEELNRIKNS